MTPFIGGKTRISNIPTALRRPQEVGSRTSKVEAERSVLQQKVKADEEALGVIESALASIESRIKQLGGYWVSGSGWLRRGGWVVGGWVGVSQCCCLNFLCCWAEGLGCAWLLGSVSEGGQRLVGHVSLEVAVPGWGQLQTCCTRLEALVAGKAELIEMPAEGLGRRFKACMHTRDFFQKLSMAHLHIMLTVPGFDAGCRGGARGHPAEAR
jgi:hypothetical protein